ncbi:MAG: cache domain-containing protein [Syntrophobacteraceae bacterium]|jgi:signal transduction histidine kinase
MDPLTCEMARGWVDEAKTFYIQVGKRIALAEFSNLRGMFSEGELYIFVLNCEGVMLAHGVNERFVGKDFIDIKDSEGKHFIKEIIDTAVEKGSGCVEYKWYHPRTKQILPKVVYFEKVDNLIICGGAYDVATYGHSLP